MKFILFSLIAFSLSFAHAKEDLLLNQYTVYNVEGYKGQTFLSFLKEDVKPALDKVATEGYQIADSETIDAIFPLLDVKIQNNVNRNGGIDAIKEIAEALQGETVTLNDLPQKIAAIDRSVDRYDMASFLGLVSGGGIAIKFAENNYAYNVHYDLTEQKSGRSFSVGPTRPANDVSYKVYLDDMQSYGIDNDPENLASFYTAALQILLNNDTKGYKDVSLDGQTALSDFLAVYVAEQIRNLMDGRITTHWDAALLEVTLLTSFHAGQDKFTFYYENPATGKVSFTSKVLEQARCEVPSKSRQATMRDYWQFSRRVDDPKNCGRSGVNITKNEFRRLGKEITNYMRENNSAKLQNLIDVMGLDQDVENVYLALSQYIINGKTSRSLKKDAYAITKAWVEFLESVRESANDITVELK